MGIVRLFLAMAVVTAHAGGVFGFTPLGGREAVQAFYLISGFYMALILDQKYTGPGSYRLFLSNRALRIYPIYWVVLVATIVVWSVSWVATGKPGPLAAHRVLNNASEILLRAADISVLGLEGMLFVGIDERGEFYPTHDFHSTPEPMAFRYSLVPPAWSLSLELQFYIVAPLILRRSVRTLLGVAAASFGLRAFLGFGLGFTHDPWTYRFFPTELGVFVLGALAYHVHLRVKASTPPMAASRVVMLGYLVVCASYQFWPATTATDVSRNCWLFVGLTWLAIPWLFLATSRSRIDRYVGELSYPTYVAHWLVLMLVAAALNRVAGSPASGWYSLATVVATLVAAIAIHHFVSLPIERFRQMRVAGSLDSSRKIRIPAE